MRSLSSTVAVGVLAIVLSGLAWAAAPAPRGPAPVEPKAEAVNKGGVTLPSGAAPSAGSFYVIECKVLDDTADGKTRILASPTVVTGEGRPAVVRVGREIPPPRGSKAAKAAFEGLRWQVKVYRTSGGQTFLDAELASSWVPENTKQDSLRLASLHLRLIEPVTLGEKLIIPLERDDQKKATGRRFELVVRDAAGHTALRAAR
ncbi:MAG: hypothetical protein A2V70_07630 [Planctomycetes bacterium RBG_13_63_9]|nr:MAG: hypothetical protein A2V70_07630 [Planctomycetes bacterium RBG_13_63_9]